MRFYKYEENNRLVCIGTGYGGTEITEAEYLDLLSEIREKASLVDLLYAREIAETDVPEEWRDEIVRLVNERIETESAYEEEEAEK